MKTRGEIHVIESSIARGNVDACDLCSSRQGWPPRHVHAATLKEDGSGFLVVSEEPRTATQRQRGVDRQDRAAFSQDGQSIITGSRAIGGPIRPYWSE